MCVCVHRLRRENADVHTKKHALWHIYAMLNNVLLYFNTKYMFCLHLVTNHGSHGKPKRKIKLKCGKILMFQTFNQLVHYFLDTLVLPHFVRCTQVKIRMCWNNLFMLVYLVSKMFNIFLNVDFKAMLYGKWMLSIV